MLSIDRRVSRRCRPPTDTVAYVTAIREAPSRGERYGILAAPKVDSLPVAKILADIEAQEVVSLPDLGKVIGMGEQSRKYAIRAGLITPTAPLAVVNRREGYKITRDEAYTLLLAAALAFAAGVAIAVMLRGCKTAGLTGAVAATALRGMA